MTLTAFNKIGSGTPTKIENARTKGKKPISPDLYHFIRTNLTSVTLELSAWQDGGCPIQYFTVELRRHDPLESKNNDWIVISSNVAAKSRFFVPDLEPSTVYNLRITAHNNAGSTIVEYNFETLNINGGLSNGDLLMPGNRPLDIDGENGNSLSIQGAFNIDSHSVLIVIIATFGALMAAICVCFCLKSRMYLISS